MSLKVCICLMAVAYAWLTARAEAETVSQPSTDPPTKVIRLSISPLGHPPYTFPEPLPQGQGILIDILKGIAQQKGYTLFITAYPEKREKIMMDQGLIDARFKAPEWVEDPENHIFTDPIMDYRDQLVGLDPKLETYTRATDLAGQYVIGIHGYCYPTLQPLFDQGTLRRIDAASEGDALKMLVLERGTAAVMNPLVARWSVVLGGKMPQKLYHSPFVVDCVGYPIMFHKDRGWEKFVDHFNKELAKMKKMGRVDELIKKYSL